MITYKQIVPDLISLVPEIRAKYEEMNMGFGSNLEGNDVNELQQLGEMHELQSETGSIGSTIVFENLLVPHVMEIASNIENRPKLLEIMDWIEKLSNSNVFEVSNLVAGSFCEPLIASNEAKLPLIYPSMGKKTRELCKMQFSRFIVSEETKKMFDS